MSNVSNSFSKLSQQPNRTKTRKQGLMACRPQLPQETLTDILVRLPVKSIIRFECVSKHWSALIKTPDFIATHLCRSSRNPTLILRYYHVPTSDSGITFLCSSLNVSDVPFINSSSRFPQIVGSCNGLVCLDISLCYASDLVFWNPTTRNFLHLPEPRIKGSGRKQPWMVALGFGFDKEANDYKFVRIVYFEDTNNELPVMRAEVFSWRKGSWREIEVGISSLVIRESQQAAMVSGSLHWIAYGVGKLSYHKFIVSFDMNNEVFKKTPLPISSGFSRVICMKVMACEGSLGLVVYPNNSGFNRFELWLIRKNDVGNLWDKVSVVEPFPKEYIPKAIWKDGKVILINLERNPHGGLYSYDHICDDLKKLPVKGADYSYEIYNFVESLVSVTGG